jgi:hypothetical protein
MVAFELKNGCFADEEEIREFCVEFPMTASGKVQEFGLRTERFRTNGSTGFQVAERFFAGVTPAMLFSANCRKLAASSGCNSVPASRRISSKANSLFRGSL